MIGKWGLFRQKSLILGLSLLLGAQAVAQASGPASSTLGFSFDFPGSDPEHYVITIASDGQATYESNGKLSSEAEGNDTYRFTFAVSQATCRQIFDLAKKAHYFENQIDSGKKNLASTGVKVLSYSASGKTNQATYNYSLLPAVQELTRLFQNLSSTLEFGRRLQYFHKYQKLALSEELKQMEDMSSRNELEEVQAIAPILQKIVDDPSVINVVRGRAMRLLAGVDQSTGSGSK